MAWKTVSRSSGISSAAIVVWLSELEIMFVGNSKEQSKIISLTRFLRQFA